MSFLNMESKIMYHHAGCGSSLALAHNEAHKKEDLASYIAQHMAVPAALNDHQKAVKKVTETNAELPENEQGSHKFMEEIREQELLILKTLLPPELL